MTHTSPASRALHGLAAAVALAAVIILCVPFDLVRSQGLQPIVPYMEERLGLDEQQVRSGLGALLIYSREHLPKPQFDQLARRMPNAELLMDDTRLRGVVTAPLDDRAEFEAALVNLGIAPQVAAQFGPVVLEFLGSAGYSEERDVLSRALD